MAVAKTWYVRRTFLHTVCTCIHQPLPKSIDTSPHRCRKMQGALFRLRVDHCVLVLGVAGIPTNPEAQNPVYQKENLDFNSFDLTAAEMVSASPTAASCVYAPHKPTHPSHTHQHTPTPTPHTRR